MIILVRRQGKKNFDMILDVNKISFHKVENTIISVTVERESNQNRVEDFSNDRFASLEIYDEGYAIEKNIPSCIVV